MVIGLLKLLLNLSMIQNKNKSVFEVGAQGIIHQANCFHTMNSGVAKQIRTLYPEAYEADCQTSKGVRDKLGTFSFAKGKDGVYIYNCYSQFDYGFGRKFTQYVPLEDGLRSIKEHAVKNNLKTLALPFGMGCIRGGGSWDVVSSIITGIFSDDSITLLICKL